MTDSEKIFSKAVFEAQPTFPLVAQDITAHLVVDFWLDIQVRVQRRVKNGMTLVQVVEDLRATYGIPRASAYMDNELTAKQRSARDISLAMLSFPNRKLAD